MSSTHRVEERPGFETLPKDRCSLTMLTGSRAGAIFTLGDELTLGRDEELTFRIDDRAVSSLHARVYQSGGRFVIEDLDSTNGTYVNGEPIVRRELRDGDRIQLGEHTLLRVGLHDATEHQAVTRMYEAAVLDPLTGIYNRGHLEAVLLAEFAFAQRHKTALTVIFVDLDHFTQINNTYGHQAGDAVLQDVAQAIRHAIRTEDLVARYGGEEFVLVARGIDLNGATAMAERIRRTVEAVTVPVGDTVLHVTASFGVASYEAATPYASSEELVAAADRALYRAKREGRNQVCRASDVAPASWRAS